MKIDHNVATVLLLGLAAGELRYPPTATSSNRLHTERAPRGSAAEAERMAAAEAKRARRASRR
jgi:hypothetical protein